TRPFPTEDDRMVRANFLGKPTPPEIIDAASGLSGPRYRGSNPCLPATILSRTITYGKLVSVSNPCLSVHHPVLGLQLRQGAIRQSPLCFHVQTRAQRSAPRHLCTSPWGRCFGG